MRKTLIFIFLQLWFGSDFSLEGTSCVKVTIMPKVQKYGIPLFANFVVFSLQPMKISKNIKNWRTIISNIGYDGRYRL